MRTLLRSGPRLQSATQRHEGKMEDIEYG